MNTDPKHCGSQYQYVSLSRTKWGVELESPDTHEKILTTTLKWRLIQLDSSDKVPTQQVYNSYFIPTFRSASEVASACSRNVSFFSPYRPPFKLKAILN